MKRAVIIGSSEAYQTDPKTGCFALSAPPLSILSVGSYLAAHSVPVELIDVEMDFGVALTPQARRAVARRVGQHLRQQAREIAWAGVSIHSNLSLGMIDGEAPVIDEIHAALPETPLVFGGYFATIEHRVLLERYPFAAAVVRGNGEAAALEISRCSAEGRPFACERTPNLAWEERGELRTTPIAALPPETLPILDFRLLRHPRAYEKIDLQTSRGCPFTCDYCYERLMRPYGAYPVDWVRRQIEHVEQVSPSSRLFLFDPIFGVGRERTAQICALLQGRGFGWGFLGRADVLPADQLPALRDAGVRTIFFGIEALSTPTLLRMSKVSSSAQAERYVARAREVLAACFENDVTPFVGIMLGYPGDSATDYEAVLAFFEDLRRAHDRSAAQPGLFILPMVTKIYDGSSLAERAGRDFPEAILEAGPLVGETFATSSRLAPETIQSFVARIGAMSLATSRAQERLRELWMRPCDALDAFLAVHPELLDEEGVLSLPRARQCSDFPA